MLSRLLDKCWACSSGRRLGLGIPIRTLSVYLKSREWTDDLASEPREKSGGQRTEP